MTKGVHYSNAPIVEALIDLRVSHAENLSTADFEAIGEKIADRYPGREPIYLHSSQITFEDPESPMQIAATNQHNGFVFISENGQQSFQARPDGITFSTLAPYDRWESFSEEARHLWSVYHSVVNPDRLTRTAIRYINQIDVREQGADRTDVDLRDYLNVYPQAPNEWIFGNFFMQIQLWQEDLKCWIIVNEAPVQASNQDAVLLQLDLDLFKELSAEETWRADGEELWDFLEQLHTRKNEVFEASITEKTRGLIR